VSLFLLADIIIRVQLKHLLSSHAPVRYHAGGLVDVCQRPSSRLWIRLLLLAYTIGSRLQRTVLVIFTFEGPPRYGKVAKGSGGEYHNFGHGMGLCKVRQLLHLMNRDA
jgi:hypothetical protein